MSEKNKKRSRAGIIFYLNKLLHEVEKECGDYSGRLNFLISAEAIIVSKSKKVVELSEEIADTILNGTEERVFAVFPKSHVNHGYITLGNKSWEQTE